MRDAWLRAWTMIAVIAGVGASLAAQPSDGPSLAKWSFTDRFARAWRNELVFLDVDPKLAGRRDVVLRKEKGSAVKFQWVTAEESPHGKPGLAFLMDVVPGGSESMILGVGVAGDFAPAVKVEETAEYVEASNGLVAIRLNRGDAAKTQGPIGGVRLPSGRWVAAKGKLTLPEGVAAHEVRVVRSGPVFTDIESIYALSGESSQPNVKPFWRFRVRLIANESAVLVHEEFDLAKAGTYEWSLGESAEWNRVHWESGYDFTRKGGAGAETLPLGKKIKPDDAYTLFPWDRWWFTRTGPWFALYKEQETDLLGVGAMNPTAWLSRPGSPPAKFPENGTGLRGWPGSAVEGLAQWNVSASFRMADRTLTLPLQGWQRDWLIASLKGEPTKRDALVEELDAAAKDADQDASKRVELLDNPDAHPIVKPDDAELSMLMNSAVRDMPNLVTKHGLLGLDRAARMTLDWPSNGVTHPRLFATEANLKALRDRQGDPANAMPKPVGDITPYNMDAWVPYYLATGDADTERAIFELGMGSLKATVARFADNKRRAAPMTDPPRTGTGLMVALCALDAVFDGKGVTDADRAKIRALVAFLGYMLEDPNVWSPPHGFCANPNMTSMLRMGLGMVACFIPDHTHARRWADIATEEMQDEITNWTGSNGGWREAPHYAIASIDVLTGYAMALRRAPFHPDRDWATHERLRLAHRWIARILTPPDPRVGNARCLPPIGNTYTGEQTALPAWTATLWKDADPAFASEMQWAWNQSRDFPYLGIGGFFHSAPGFRWTMFSHDILPKQPDGASEVFPSVGAVMRAHFATPQEMYVHYIEGNLHEHYDADSGSFIFWGKGKPLCEDFGYYGAAPMYDHNRPEGPFGSGQIQRLVTSPAADVLHGLNTGWDRRILMVKDSDPKGPNYIVVNDKLPDAAAKWRVWVATDESLTNDDKRSAQQKMLDDPGAFLDEAEAVKVKGLHRAKGRHGVDLALFIAAPNDVAITSERAVRVSAAGGFASGRALVQHSLMFPMNAGSSATVVLFPVMPKEPNPTFQTSHNGACIRIAGKGWSDQVFFSPVEIDIKQDGVEFKGTQALVQRRGGRTIVTLPAAGRIVVDGVTIESDGKSNRADSRTLGGQP